MYLEPLQVVAALPGTLTVTLEWSEVFLTSAVPLLRHHTASLLGISSRAHQDKQIVDSWGVRILQLLSDKVLTSLDFNFSVY